VILFRSMSADDSLPNDIITLKAIVRAERAARLAAEAEAQARTLLIEKLKITIMKLRHEQFGQSSERGSLLDQLELQLADLEENTAQTETAAQLAAAETITVACSSGARRRAVRCPRICRASGSFIHHPRPALAAAGRRCAKSARM
jgi:transposase